MTLDFWRQSSLVNSELSSAGALSATIHSRELLRHKVPIGYNKMSHIYPPKVPLPFDDLQPI